MSGRRRGGSGGGWRGVGGGGGGVAGRLAAATAAAAAAATAAAAAAGRVPVGICRRVASGRVAVRGAGDAAVMGVKRAGEVVQRAAHLPELDARRRGQRGGRGRASAR